MVQPLTFVSCKGGRIALAMLTAFSCLLAPPYPPAAAAFAARSADRTSIVLFADGSQSSRMSGSIEDLRRAKALRAGREGLLYLRRGGAAYVIHDAATLRQAESIFRPQEILGARQAELGSRQAALGAEQARLGLRQAGASPRQQEMLGRRQEELGRQQDALGRQQGTLGREQERLAREADTRFRTLLDEALRRGVARRID